MNTTSPLVPQGAIPPRPKNSLYIKILMVLSVHVVVIGGMLLQGCKDTSNVAKNTDGGATAVDTNLIAGTTPVPMGSNDSIVSSAALSNSSFALPAPGTVPGGPAPTMTVPTPITTTTPVGPSTITPIVTPTKDLTPAPAGPGSEYVVAKGDLLATIAHRNGVSLKALEEANPGVNPKKLKVGQKLQIPAGTAMASAKPATTDAGAMAVTGGDSDVYVVKSGDTLSKIAKLHKVSYKKIMAMNELKSTSIHAGQKLKMPSAKATAPASDATVPSVTPATTPAGSSNGMKVSSVTAPISPMAKN